MPLFLVLLIYNALLPLVLVVLLPLSALKMRRRGGYGAKFWQRFGVFDGGTEAALAEVAGRCRWVHAVSVGEVNVARKLIGEMLRAEPEVPVVLSVTTSTGYAVAEEQAPGGVVVIYSPVDLPWVVGRVFRRLRPRQLILVEAEVWPNVLWRARRAGVPVILVNARLSPRSEGRFRRFRGLVAPIFGMLDQVLVQEPEDVGRWESLGVAPGALRVVGSIKFDQRGQAPSSPKRVAVFRELLREAFGGEERRVVLAASTHAGEEQALARMWKEIGPEFPGVRLLMAPRHAERRGEVQAAVAACGWSVALRSALGAEGGSGVGAEVVVIDSTGELRDWQALAEVVMVGKSFLAKGGQNPAEAIAAGVAVVAGPHMENFAALMKLLGSADGVRQVAGLEALGGALRELLARPEAAQAMAERGRRALARHAGATARTAECVRLS